jgi:hypothetical protein
MQGFAVPCVATTAGTYGDETKEHRRSSCGSSHRDWCFIILNNLMFSCFQTKAIGGTAAPPKGSGRLRVSWERPGMLV